MTRNSPTDFLTYELDMVIWEYYVILVSAFVTGLGIGVIL